MLLSDVVPMTPVENTAVSSCHLNHEGMCPKFSFLLGAVLDLLTLN